jgi:heme A synthase
MRALHVTVATLVLAFVLILLGGVVHATGSSLACPDWPLCFGELMPAMRGGVLFEHAHRLVASAVGALAVVQALLLLARWQDKGYRIGGGVVVAIELVQLVLMGAAVSGSRSATVLAAAWLLCLAALGGFVALWPAKDRLPLVGLMALEIVIIQGLFGGLTVVLRLPPLVSTLHLATSLLFLGVLVYLALALRSGVTPSVSPLVSRGALGVAVVGIYLQDILGALVRHSASGMACGTTLLSCNGSLAPLGGPAQLHFTHRLVAMLVAVIIVAVTLRILRATRAMHDPRRDEVRKLAVTAHVLVGAQIILGAITVLSHISVVVVTAHLALAALLLANLVALYVLLGPFGLKARQLPREPASSVAAG